LRVHRLLDFRVHNLIGVSTRDVHLFIIMVF